MKRPILVVSNVLISQAGELLLGLRSDCLKWETPGGKVENETVVEAAVREQEEETGLTLIGEPATLGFSDGRNWDGGYGRPWYVVIFLLWKKWSGFPQIKEDRHL